MVTVRALCFSNWLSSVVVSADGKRSRLHLHCLSLVIRTVNGDAVTPAGIELDVLEYQLRNGGIAFGAGAESDAELAEQLTGAIDEAAPHAGLSTEQVGVVVLGHSPAPAPDIRDVAQDLQRATGLDTVLVRTPDVVIGVSEKFTRAQVEIGERAMASQHDYASGVSTFLRAAGDFEPVWLQLGLLAVLVVVICIAATLASLATGRRRPREDN